MRKLRIAAVVLIALVGAAALVWALVVPEAVKQLIAFSSWRKSHVRGSGYVEREPAGTRVFWEEYGAADAAPVVVLHGAFGTIGTMGAQIPPLAERWRVLAIESRGHGKSPSTADVMKYETMSDDVIAVMDARGIARADVVGWSDGGNIGLDLARRYPERVRRVVAYGAVYDNTGADAKTIAGMRASTPTSDDMQMMKGLYEKYAPVKDRWPLFFAQMQTMLLDEPKWTLEQMATIRAPLLLVNGETDLVRREHATALRTAVPGARLEIIAGVGHEAPLERPREVNALTLAFLAAP